MHDGKMKYLADVLHVPNITKNLVSVGQMIEHGLQVRFNFDGCYVENFKNDCRLVAKGKHIGKIFTLDVNMTEVKSLMFAQGAGVVANVEIWHKRIGHVNEQQLRNMQSGFPKFKVDGMHKVCEACQFGKQSRSFKECMMQICMYHS